MLQPIIKVMNFTKKYGDFTAVENISFSVEKVRFLDCWDRTVQGRPAHLNH